MDNISRNFDQNLEKIDQIFGKMDQNLGKSLSKGPKNIKILSLKGSIFDFGLGHTRHLGTHFPREHAKCFRQKNSSARNIPR